MDSPQLLSIDSFGRIRLGEFIERVVIPMRLLAAEVKLLDEYALQMSPVHLVAKLDDCEKKLGELQRLIFVATGLLRAWRNENDQRTLMLEGRITQHDQRAISTVVSNRHQSMNFAIKTLFEDVIRYGNVAASIKESLSSAREQASLFSPED